MLSLLVRILVGLAVASMIGFGLWQLSAPDPQRLADSRRFGTQTAPVLVDTVKLTPVLTRLEAVGTSRAQQSADLYPAAQGEVRRVAFEAGQYVEQGAVLVELDARRERLAVRLAQVRLTDARRTLERRQELAGKGAVTEAALDEAERLTEEAVIALDQAKVALEDRTVRAPFAGHVGTTDVDAGDRITPTTLITTLDDRRILLVEAVVPEAYIGDLRIGREVDLAPWNAPDSERIGQVVDIGSRVDPVTRSFPVRLAVANPDDRLRPGQSFRVALELTGRAYPAVPETAVMWGATGAYVWRIKGGQADRVRATIVERRKGQVLIEAALEAGDTVVMEGTQRLRQGMAVEIRPSGPVGSLTAITAGSGS